MKSPIRWPFAEVIWFQNPVLLESFVLFAYPQVTRLYDIFKNFANLVDVTLLPPELALGIKDTSPRFFLQVKINNWVLCILFELDVK